MAAAGEEDDPAAKSSRVGGQVVNMVGGIECGFDGVLDMEPDGSEVQRILYAGADSDGSGLDEELIDEDVADMEAIENDAEVGLDLIGMSTPYDQRTFLEIPRDLAQEGRKTEIEKMKFHDVFEVVPEDKLRGKSRSCGSASGFASRSHRLAQRHRGTAGSSRRPFMGPAVRASFGPSTSRRCSKRPASRGRASCPGSTSRGPRSSCAWCTATTSRRWETTRPWTILMKFCRAAS
jgi:hypothetical protein